MKGNNFEINCPQCESTVDLLEDRVFTNDLLNDVDNTELICPNCKGEFTVKTECTYSFSIVEEDNF